MAKTWRLHIVLKFVLTYVFLVIIVTFVFAYTFYIRFSDHIFTEVRDEVSTSAKTIAGRVDFSGMETLKDPAQKNSEIYKRIFNDLNLIAESTPDLTYVYTVRPRADGTWEFVVDASQEEDTNGNGVIDPSEASAAIGETYDVSCCQELPKSVNGPTAYKKITSDGWGGWISGYAPIYDEKGTVIGIVGVDFPASRFLLQNALLRDRLITSSVFTLLLSLLFGMIGVTIYSREARQIQEALEIRNEDLEREVRRRMEERKRFIAMMVHELRSPLTSLKYDIELLSGGRKSKQDKELLEMMAVSTERLVHMVSELLDLSLFTSDEFTIDKTPTDIKKLVSGVVKEFASEAAAKDLELKVKFITQLPKVNCDQQRMQEVVRNLISNAIKYTEKGKVDVSTDYNKEKKLVRIEVKDSGKGIAATDMKKLFQPFARFEVKGEVGTGLGLAIAKSIVEKHGGKLTVESKKGKGSAFRVELPIK